MPTHPATLRFMCLILLMGSGLATASRADNPLYHAPEGTARRAGSASPVFPHGSSDFCNLSTTTALLIADLAGPGRITHAWFTFGTNSGTLPADWAHRIELQIFWDDETSPSVKVPLGLFFAQGPTGLTPLNTAMVRVAGQQRGGFSCYWPMPFNQRARVLLLNRTGVAIDHCYYQLDWLALAQPDPLAWYFHASHRADTPKRPGTGDFILADISGPGRLVGAVYAVRHTTTTQEMFEADERLYVDDDPQPTLAGTGTEDYIGGAWGLHSEQGLYAGCTSTPAGFTLYRWHLADPVPFQTHLKFCWENMGQTGGSFAEQTYYPSAVCCWYAPPAEKNATLRWEQW